MSFLDLPREIRDSIYIHLFPACLYTIPSITGRQPANFSILRTSKQISDEAVEVLYQKSCIMIELGLGGWAIPRAFFSPKTTNLIQDISIAIPSTPFSNYDLSRDEFPAIMFRLLELTRPSRKCRISIKHPANWMAEPHFDEQTFFNQFKMLGGYQTVTIEFKRPIKRLRVPFNRGIESMNPWGEIRIDTKTLEPYLGSVSEYNATIAPPRTCQVRSLVFEPRRYVANLSLEEKEQICEMLENLGSMWLRETLRTNAILGRIVDLRNNFDFRQIVGLQ
ncbi:hypothetical protein ACLMJK_001625 [Lecanora helva]